MALTTSVKVTNHTASTYKAPSAYDLTEKTNYVIKEVSDGGQDTVIMKNKTVNTDMYGEQINRWFKDNISLKSVSSPLSAYVNTPAEGVSEVGVQEDLIVVTDNDADPMTGEVRDLVRAKIVLQWTKSPYITAALLQEALTAALSQYFDQTAGSSRLTDFMRGSINPKDNIA